MNRPSELFLAVLLSFLLVATFNVRGVVAEPPPEGWARTYGGTGTEMARSMVETSDGGYAIAGYTYSYGAGDSDFWLVRTDSNGNALWNKTYGGTGQDWAYSMVQTADGGYALAGITNSYGAGGSDFWLVKVNALGIIPELWSVVLMITVTLTTVLMKKKFRAILNSARHT